MSLEGSPAGKARTCKESDGCALQETLRSAGSGWAEQGNRVGGVSDMAKRVQPREGCGPQTDSCSLLWWPGHSRAPSASLQGPFQRSPQGCEVRLATGAGGV